MLSLEHVFRWKLQCNLLLCFSAYRTQPSLFLLVSKLDLTSAPALTSNINTDLEIKCSVISTTSASSRYAVTWLLQQQAEKQIIVSSDRDALLAFGPQVELSHRQRISMKRTKGPSFELSIRQAQISDGGSYTCEVVEWLQDPRGDWYELSPVSRTTNVTVLEPGKLSPDEHMTFKSPKPIFSASLKTGPLKVKRVKKNNFLNLVQNIQINSN